MNDKDIEKFMVQDFIFTDSDGSDGHPRKYGTFPKLLREYVLHEARADAAAGGAAQQLAASAVPRPQGSRHVRRPGKFADVIVFDPETIADKSTYEQPTLLAVGMKYVLVNGVIAIDDGKYAGARRARCSQTVRAAVILAPTGAKDRIPIAIATQNCG